MTKEDTTRVESLLRDVKNRSGLAVLVWDVKLPSCPPVLKLPAQPTAQTLPCNHAATHAPFFTSSRPHSDGGGLGFESFSPRSPRAILSKISHFFKKITLYIYIYSAP